MAEDFRSRVDPDLLPLLRMLPFWTWTPWRTALVQPLMRRIPAWIPKGLTGDVQRIEGRELRILRPEGPLSHDAAILWLHGGGRVMGHPRQDTATCGRLARELGVVVVAAEYRVGVFPAALDDCVAAWHWLVDHADALGVDPSKLFIGGESAGGGLAAETCQRLLDEGAMLPRAQLLVYPMLDDRTAADQSKTDASYLVWSNASNHHAWSAYLGVEPGAAELPPYAAAARREDVAGLPPAWLMVGDLDLFAEEIQIYARRLEEAGVEVKLLEIQGGFHAMFAVGTNQAPIARIWDSLQGFVRARLGDA